MTGEPMSEQSNEDTSSAYPTMAQSSDEPSFISMPVTEAAPEASKYNVVSLVAATGICAVDALLSITDAVAVVVYVQIAATANTCTRLEGVIGTSITTVTDAIPIGIRSRHCPDHS